MGLGGFVVPKWRVAPLVFRVPAGPAAVCAGGRRPAREPSALRFLAFLLSVVTNVVNPRAFSLKMAVLGVD